MTMLEKLAAILLESTALRFGDFTTKAGRRSPYFVNFGHIHRSDWLNQLAELYLNRLKESDAPETEIIFGPAYKGIILAIASSMHADSAKPLSFAFNRKEAKDHGEGGTIVGHPLPKGSRVVLIDDVLSRGTSSTESIEMLKKRGVEVSALLIAIDREERGFGDKSAKDEIEEKFGIPVLTLSKISTLSRFLCDNDVNGKRWLSDGELKKIDDYRKATFS